MYIRNRLVIWHTGILAVFLLAVIAVLYLSFRFHLNQEVDESLLAWASQKYVSLDPQTRMDMDESHNKTVDMMPESFAIVFNMTRGNIDDSTLKSPELISEIERYIKNLTLTQETLRKTFTINHQLYRVYIFRLNPVQSGDQRRLVIGRSLNHVDSTILELTGFLSLVWLISVLICAGLSWFFVGRTLRPVKQMTRTSLQIAGSKELGRRIEDFGCPDDEFGELSQAMNRMLESLEALTSIQKKFLADASHELRTPLTSIRANLEFLERARNIPEQEKQQAFRDVLSEVYRLSGLVNELLMLARADEVSSFKFEWVDVAAIVREVHNSIRMNEEAAKRTIRCEASPKALIKGDAEKLRQVALILLDNAVKYSPVNGEIIISVYQQDKKVVLDVINSGTGIPDAELNRLSERFYRASNAGSTPGTGLGLAIAKSIVQQHGGEIRLSNADGVGFRAEVLLPG